MSRVRSKVNIHESTGTSVVPWKRFHLGTLELSGSYGPTGPCTSDDSIEEMTDEVTVPPPDYHRVKPVTHTKEDYRFPLYGNVGSVTLGTGGTYRYEVSGKNDVLFMGQALSDWYSLGPAFRDAYFGDEATRLRASGISVVWAKSRQQLLNNCLDAFYHGTNEGSTFEDAIESVKLSHDMKSIRERIRKIGLLNDSRLFRSRSIRRRLLGRVGRFASGTFLFYSFAVAPLLRDMMEVNRTLSLFEREFRRYLSTLSKPRRYSSHCSGQVTYTRGTAFTPTGTYGLSWVPRYSYLKAPERRVVLVGVNHNRYNTELFNKIQFLTERLGASGPASLAWEFVPFSFVLDWFVDTRSVLGFYDNLLTGWQKEITAISESTSYDIESFARFDKGTAAIDWPAMASHESYSRVRYYHREPISAEHQFSLSGVFGKKQLLLSAALLYEIVSNITKLGLR